MNRFKYILYIVRWKWDHRGKEFRGMAPACYSEWFNNEHHT